MRNCAGYFRGLGAALMVSLAAACGREGRTLADDPMPSEARGAITNADMLDAQADLEAKLQTLGSAFGGHVGIAVQDVRDKRTVHFNGLEMFPQQSVTKLWVSFAALDLAERGELDFEENVTLGRNDLTVFYQPIRKIVLRNGSFSASYGELMDRALAQSDNTANDAILRRVGGPDVVQAWLDRNGLERVRMGPDERTKQSAIAGLAWRQSYSIGKTFFDVRDTVPDAIRRDAFQHYLADPVDGAAPVSIAEALGGLYRGELLDQALADRLIGILETTRSGPNRLKGGLAPGWNIAHKTGTGQFYEGTQSGYNDVGVITSPDGREYAIAVMIGNTREPTPARMELMQAVTRAVIAYHQGLAARAAGN